MKFLFIQKWHKKIGVYTALFVIFLAISGIALNHTEKLKLNTTYIKTDIEGGLRLLLSISN